jgi:hypothetical protein
LKAVGFDKLSATLVEPVETNLPRFFEKDTV